uniref:Si:ch211-81a5.5 n=1 Tax=Cyprinus carpio TaxID=7962 RepID=A0A8C1SKD7_CYPCA
MKKRVEKSSKEKVDKVDSVTDEEPPKTADDYQCSGNLELDFTELCKLMGLKQIPSVKIKQSTFTNRGVMARTEEESQFQTSLESQMTTWSSKPCLQIELENEDHGSVKEVKISGWKVDEVVLQVLSRIFPSLSNLQCLHMWRAGLTDSTFTSIRNTVSLCSNLRKVVLEGNRLPEQSYHLLIGEDSMLTDLSLRNNHIGEEGARLIGLALSTVHSANKNLLSLNLAFNSIGDAGAIHIAQGLRLNRSLLCLSLSYNQIGDNGAAHLAEVYLYTPINNYILFTNTDKHRRNMLNFLSLSLSLSLSLALSLSLSIYMCVCVCVCVCVSTVQTYFPLNIEAFVCQRVEVVETVIPLLDPGIVHTGGKVIHPGNKCLTSMNLSGDFISELISFLY